MNEAFETELKRINRYNPKQSSRVLEAFADYVTRKLLEMKSGRLRPNYTEADAPQTRRPKQRFTLVTTFGANSRTRCTRALTTNFRQRVITS